MLTINEKFHILFIDMYDDEQGQNDAQLFYQMMSWSRSYIFKAFLILAYTSCMWNCPFMMDP